MKHAWSGNRTPTGRVTSGHANHYTTVPLYLDVPGKVAVGHTRNATGLGAPDNVLLEF